MTALKAEDPFVNKNGEPDLDQFKSLFGFKSISDELKDIIDEKPGSIRQAHALRLLNNPKFAAIKHIASMLYAQFKDIGLCRQWLQSGRSEWLGESPMDLIKAGRVEYVERYLKQKTNPKGMTFGG